MIDVPVLQLEDGVADLHALTLGVTVGQFTTDHTLDDALFGEVILALFQGLDGVTVTDDGDGVSNVADLVQLMGNDDTGDAFSLQLQHQLQQLSRLTVVQCCGGLVQDQQFALLAQCLCDFDQLLLAYAQGVDGNIDVLTAQTNTIQQSLCFCTGLDPVDNALGLALVAQEDVLSDGQVGAQCQLLMDDDDALFFTVLDVAELADLTIVNDVAGIVAVRIDAGKNVHQGGLTCAVFAADCHDLTLTNLQVDVIKSLDTGERLGDLVHFQDIF